MEGAELVGGGEVGRGSDTEVSLGAVLGGDGEEAERASGRSSGLRFLAACLIDEFGPPALFE